MAKRRPTPPYLTLPDDALQAEPADGWELIVEGQPHRVIPDRELFPSWDSSLKFALRRRFTLDLRTFSGHLGISSGRVQYQFVTRLGTARGLMSEVAFRQVLDADENVVEVEIAPDSRRLSRDILLACSVVIVEAKGELGLLSPTQTGSRVWYQSWSSKLEGGRVRLPIEVISFAGQLHDLSIPNALIHVTVADDPGLEFEQAVCAFLNADQPQFIADFEKGEPMATAMVWDAVVRQVLSAGLTTTFQDDEESIPEDSIGAQVQSWIASIFPGESRQSIAAIRQESPGLFEGRIQSWVNAGTLWTADKP